MSTLEKIRQRPILIISILGLALLLFILTAVDRPGELFTDSHTVAKVDGEKIDYMEFQKRVEHRRERDMSVWASPSPTASSRKPCSATLPTPM